MSGTTNNGRVPRLRFPEFRGTEVWKATPLEELGAIVTGKTPSTKEDNLWGGKIFFITPTDITEDQKYQHKTQRTVVETAGTKLLPPGSVVYTCIASIGKVALTVAPSISNQQINAIVPNGKMTGEFIYYSLVNLTPWIKSITATSTLPIINKTQFSGFIIHHPEHKVEQQKIADCLSSLDDLITLEAQKLDSLKAHKKGLMQQLFPREGETQPRLRFPEFQNAGEWVVKAIGDVFKVTRGEVLSMTLVKDEASSEAPYPVYSSQTKSKGLAGYYSEYLYKDAITWTTDGANAGNVNFRPGKFYCTNVCGVLINTYGYANTCVAALLNSVTHSHVSYVGNPKLMNGVMARIEIPFPSVPEQQRIASCLTSLDDLITAQTQKLETLKTHKKGLMQQLFPQVSEE